MIESDIQINTVVNPTISHLDDINIYLGDPFDIYFYILNYDHFEIQKENSGTWNTIYSEGYYTHPSYARLSEITHGTDNGNYRIVVYSQTGATLPFVTSNEFKVTTSAPPAPIVSKVTLYTSNHTYSNIGLDQNGDHVVNNLSRSVQFYTFSFDVEYDDHGVSNSDSLIFPYINKFAATETPQGNANKVTGGNECDYGSQSVRLVFNTIPTNITSTKISLLIQMSDLTLIEKTLTINFAPV